MAYFHKTKRWSPFYFIFFSIFLIVHREDLRRRVLKMWAKLEFYDFYSYKLSTPIQNLKVTCKLVYFECPCMRTHTKEKPSKIPNVAFTIFNWMAMHPKYFGIYFSWWNHSKWSDSYFFRVLHWNLYNRIFSFSITLWALLYRWKVVGMNISASFAVETSQLSFR